MADGSSVSHHDDHEDSMIASYVNASFINGLVRGFSEKSIIACQAPTKKSILKFWQTAWETKSKIIIMLCPTSKEDSQECINYWLNEENEVGLSKQIESNELNKPIFEIKLTSLSTVKEGIIKREFQLTFVAA